MKLKAICQDCGKTSEIDTDKLSDWKFEDVKDEADKSDNPVEWTVWYCGSCRSDEEF